MHISVPGRVENIYLPVRRPLLPLFEAISNSIHAIESGPNSGKGQITVIVNRNDIQGSLLDSETKHNDICGFEIIDNGAGFNDKNFESFQTSDSRAKRDLGGKGVGRFLWLKAFARVQIESSYLENETWKKRAFEFSLDTDEGISKLDEGELGESEFYTRIRFIDYREPYIKNCPKKLDTIAHRIIEHFIGYFLAGKFPHTIITDHVNEDIVLNDSYLDLIALYSIKETIELQGYQFDINHIKNYSLPEMNDHKLFYCAHDRVVFSVPLKKRNHYLKSALGDLENGKQFYYSAYVKGQYLDKYVNTERTGFVFANDDEMDFGELISQDLLENSVLNRVNGFLERYMEPEKENSFRRIEKFIRENSPQYQILMKRKRDDLLAINSNVSDEKLDVELYQILQKCELEAKQLFEKLDKGSLVNISTDERYRELYDRYAELITDIGKSSLANYVVHRKIILELLKKLLKYRDDNKYELEKEIHQIIYPMGCFSDEIDYEDHNLWIIDEKLAYHHFIASDISIKKAMKKLELVSDSQKEPDIVTFNRKMVYVDSDNEPFNSVVLIEFKRPGDVSYTDSHNPFAQIYKYVEDIRSSKRKTDDGRPISTNESTLFYCYVIADLSPSLITHARIASLKQTPDSMGYYGYNEGYNAHVEVIPYSKLLQNAMNRNKILFDKLNKCTDPMVGRNISSGQ